MAHSQTATRTTTELNGMLIILLLAMIGVVIGLTLISWDASVSLLPPTVSTAIDVPVKDDCQPRKEWVDYILPDGESLATIARRVGVSVAILESANCLHQSQINPGAALYLPALPTS